jgi:hypothetical protein
MSTKKTCPCCGQAIADTKTAVLVEMMEDIIAYWNRTASPLGFAKVKKLTAARARTIKNAIRDYPDMADWEQAVRAYCADAKRWPERVKYGFDTMIRPSQRDKWFETKADTPSDMSDDEADDFYLRDMR